MQVKNEELRSTREVAREINSILDSIDKGDVEKIVITDRQGKMRGVIIHPESYDEITSDLQKFRQAAMKAREVDPGGVGRWLDSTD
jgi:hypothetical protein